MSGERGTSSIDCSSAIEDGRWPLEGPTDECADPGSAGDSRLNAKRLGRVARAYSERSGWDAEPERGSTGRPIHHDRKPTQQGDPPRDHRDRGVRWSDLRDGSSVGSEAAISPACCKDVAWGMGLNLSQGLSAAQLRRVARRRSVDNQFIGDRPRDDVRILVGGQEQRLEFPGVKGRYQLIAGPKGSRRCG
jgi:hypothetical protein